RLFGDAGNDLITGGPGALVDGGTGDNSIRGGPGSVLLAQGGNNLIDVKGTEARVAGGPGNKTFRYLTSNPKATLDDFLKLATDFNIAKDTVVAYCRTNTSIAAGPAQATVAPESSDDFTTLWSFTRTKGMIGSKNQ